MTLPVRRPVVLAAAVVLGIVALACSSGTGESGPDSPADTATKAIAEPGTPDPELSQPSITGTPLVPSTDTGTEPYDPNRIMFRFFPGIAHSPESTRDALQAVLEQRDVSLVPILVEAARFMPSRVYDQYAATLEELTGETFDGVGFSGVGWGAWMEWLGNNLEEYQPPEEYLDWKISFMSQISPRFVQFLEPAKQFSRVDPTEIVWGGVRPDGIPDLRNPNAVSAADAGYMLPDDRVVGVSINEEVRAYPLRILNPHEMINDVLGGEPISVLW